MTIYVIAEAGVNHNGSIETAVSLIEAAASCGADAVKFQTFNADELATDRVETARYQRRDSVENTSQREMLSRLELTMDDFLFLSKKCVENDIDFITTCFDSQSLNSMMHKLRPPVLKVGSGDLTNLPFLIEHSRTGKNIILSTGMSSLAEVEDAIAALAYGYLSEAGSPESYIWLKNNFFTEKCVSKIRDKVTLLHCTTDYPAQPEDLNLKAISILQAAFQFKTGFSDHSIGMEACCAAVTLGATCIEKHLTLDKRMPGPDHLASASPPEFTELVLAIRNLEKALFPAIKAPCGPEITNLGVARKYLVADAEIKAGQKFSENNIAIKRTGYGTAPKHYWDIIGTTSPGDLYPGDPI